MGWSLGVGGRGRDDYSVCHTVFLLLLGASTSSFPMRDDHANKSALYQVWSRAASVLLSCSFITGLREILHNTH